MSGYDHENKDVFKAIGINKKEAISSWNEFIIEYLPIVAKYSLESRIKFLENQIAKKESLFTAFCFIRVISNSMCFGGAKIINSIIFGLKSLIICDDDKKIENQKDVELFFNGLGFSEEAIDVLVEKADNFRKELADLRSTSKRVEAMERFISEKALSNMQKAIMIDSVILTGLSTVLELDNIGRALFEEMLSVNAEDEKGPEKAKGGGDGTIH